MSLRILIPRSKLSEQYISIAMLDVREYLIYSRSRVESFATGVTVGL